MKVFQEDGRGWLPDNGISYSAYKQFYSGREEYVRARIFRVGKELQTFPMAIGNVFDALIKADLLGVAANFRGVEHNAAEAVKVGTASFDWYRGTGHYSEVRRWLDKADSWSVVDDLTVVVRGPDGEIHMTGKPDLTAVRDGCVSILDYKHTDSPKPSITGGHIDGRGVILGHDPWVGSYSMEGVGREYGEQLTIYSWLTHGMVGHGCESWGWIEKVCPQWGRVIKYKGKLTSDLTLWGRLLAMQRALASGHVFFEVSREESDRKMERLQDECMKLNSLTQEADGEYLMRMLGRNQ